MPSPAFDRDDLLAKAQERAGGLTDLGPGPFLDGMDRFVDSLNAEARLNDIGRFIAEERVLLHVTNRLLYTHDREQHPEIASVDVVKPVFIIGLPRTGTTILHDILNQDPANRAPLTWELMFPSPPPEASIGDEDPRVAACQATIPDDDLQSTLFKAMHPMGATLSQECVVMMGEAMVTPLFHNQFRVPAYQDWVDDGADWSAVYAFHRRQLQHLWWHKPGDRWMLKTGAHMWGLDQLLATYPDARIVFTHRDPVKSMTSYASLTTLVRSMGSDDVDPHEIAADWTARLKRMLERSMAVRTARDYPDAVFYDMYFSDFVADQFAEVERIYDALDLPMSAEGATGMRQYIADHPKGVDGIHRYRPEEYGVDPDTVRRDFAPYIERFGLEPEAPEPEDGP
ncbi:MAG TPA: sulfotransferase [Acidimicrobiales bacterium]|nr:sulfotransferase [Acidimicrobiales bacterium]